MDNPFPPWAQKLYQNVAGLAVCLRLYQHGGNKLVEMIPSKGQEAVMKSLTTVVLMLNLGVAGGYAQHRPINMTFSGTSAPSTINLLQPGTTNSEDNTAGIGTLGSFTFRNVRAIPNAPQPSSSCSGPTKIHFLSVVGAGVFHFQDGSLLTVKLTQGDDCIDFAAPAAHCTMTFQITGGTGRFKGASGAVTLTESVLPVLADASGNPVFFASTGEFTGTVSGVE